MACWRRLWCGVALVAFVTGCSGYRSHYPAGGDPDLSATTGIERDLEQGDRVRVTFADGSRIEGEIQSVDAKQLALATEEKDSDLDIIEAASIVSIEKYSDRGKTTKIIVGSVFAAALVAGIIAMSTYESSPPLGYGP